MKSKDFLMQGHYYLIHNHGNGTEPIFKKEENYYYFLKKHRERMSEYWQLIAWNLLPGSYRFLIKINDDFHKTLSHEKINKIIYSEFGNFTKGYTVAMNKTFNRKGSLFAKKFSRKLIAGDLQLRRDICLIHHEPVKMGFVQSTTDWKFSSYNKFFQFREDLQYHEMIRPFGNEATFIAEHNLLLTGKLAA